MNLRTMTGDDIVDSVITNWPQSIPVFVRHRTDCVGCAMTVFCTLTDVAHLYGVDLNTLLADLNSSVQSGYAAILEQHEEYVRDRSEE